MIHISIQPKIPFTNQKEKDDHEIWNPIHKDYEISFLDQMKYSIQSFLQNQNPHHLFYSILVYIIDFLVNFLNIKKIWNSFG